MRSRILPLLLLSLAAVACGPGPAPYEIRLASAGETATAPRFVIRQHGNPGTPWFFGVTLWDDLGAYHWRADWKGPAAGGRTRHSSETLTYGAMGAGWSTAIGPAPLRRGEAYLLEIAGSGEGFFRFRVGADGVVREDGIW